MTKLINRSLVHGLDILLLYDTSTPCLTVSEISKKLGYSLSKTYRLTRALLKRGFLRENPGTAEYALGLSSLRIGLLAKQNLDLPAVARPFMKELALLAKETVLLTVINGTRGICLERVESEEPIRYSLFQPGADLPLHCGASSKVLLAYMNEEDWDRIIAKEGLKRYTDKTITEVEGLKSHLREIRRKGYAFSDEEADRDVRAVAAPIFDAAGELVAGLSVAGPAYRIKKKRVGSLVKLVMECAGKISLSLGCRDRGNRKQ
jgi:IclR family transcriptional regulator, KDG regulon repressor